jgi:hypothetical protein
MSVISEFLKAAVLDAQKRELQDQLSKTEGGAAKKKDIRAEIRKINKSIQETKKRIAQLRGSLKGGALPAGLIQEFFKASHEPVERDVKDWVIDKPISDRWTRVYHNQKKNWTVSVTRGSGDLKDVWFDAQLLFGHKNNDRFNSAEKIIEKAKQKYDPSRMTLLGSSLGGAVVDELGRKNPDIHEVITSGRPTLFKEAFNKTPVPDNQTDVRTTGDPISVLKKLQPGKNDIEKKTKTPLDPVKSHVGNHVFSEKYFDPDEMVGVPEKKEDKPETKKGKGAEPDLKKMKMDELKTFIKEERRRKKLKNKDWKVSGLRKAELREMALKIINV